MTPDRAAFGYTADAVARELGQLGDDNPGERPPEPLPPKPAAEPPADAEQG